MDFRLLSPSSRAADARSRRAKANSAAITSFQTIYHKKKGWVRPLDLKVLLIKTLRVNISDKQFAALMSTPFYVSCFGESGTRRISLKQLHKKMQNSNKRSVRVPEANRSRPARGSVSPKRAHMLLKKCILSSCQKQWYGRPKSRQKDADDGWSKPIAPNAYGKRKNKLDYDKNGSTAATLRWYNAAGSSPFTARRSRTSYGRRGHNPRDLMGGGAKHVMDWDSAGVNMTADQAQIQVGDTMRLHFGSITKAFRTADADKSGFLSPRELRCMLTRLGIAVSDHEFNKFLHKYDDVLQDGKIDYREFASKFGGNANNSLPGLPGGLRPKPIAHRTKRFSAEQALVLLEQKMKSKFRNVTSAFLSADRNHDGHLTWQELREVLDQWQISMSDSEYMRMVQMVVSGFGAGQRHSSISLEQFKHSVLGSAVAAGTDPGMLDRHKDYMIMHGLRNKRERKPVEHTSLPGLGDLTIKAPLVVSPMNSTSGKSKFVLPTIK